MPAASAGQNYPEQNPKAQGERQLHSKVFREWKGVNTKANRTAMPEDTFYDLTNLQPIGPANIHSVPNISGLLYNFAADIVYLSQYVQLGATQYQILLTTNGKVFTYHWGSGTVTQINSGVLLSGAGSNLAQWMNTYILFIDSTGYYSWNGSAFTLLNTSPIPTAGTCICVFAGRVWIANGRLITYTSAYDGTSTNDPTQNTAWEAANGSGFLNMTDPTLSGSITGLVQQNGYLYIIGATCIYALSDIYVPTGATPPTPVFTLTPVQSIIGTDQPYSIFPYNRLMMFANRFGAWALSGVDAQKISGDIDGTWQYLTFSPQITGGQVVINNILCAGFLITRLDDPVFGSGPVIAMWFDGKWWFANYGDITLVATALINNVPALTCFIGNRMYQCFEDMTTAPNTRAMTPLWAMDDPFSLKALIRAGIETNVTLFGGEVSLTVDGTQGSTAFPVSPVTGDLVFVNNAGAPITFVGAGDIAWVTSSYLLYSGAPPGVWSSYVGMTLTSEALGFQLASFLLDYKKSARWGAQ